MKRVLAAAMLLSLAAASRASANNLTLTVGGKVSIELLSSDAFFHNTLSIVAPGVAVAITGCKLEPADGLTGVRILSEKNSVHGCRVTLDADPATPGVQGFAAGTVLKFNMCAKHSTNNACDDIWSSDPSENGDGNFDHVRTTDLHAAEYPNRIFQLGWEDESGGGDQDFNDLVAVVRVDLDSDGDGLWDDWERFGVDTDGDGTIDLDLPALGASVNHKDVFLEIDWMDCAVAGGDCASGDSHSHRPDPAAVTAVINAFAGANITNPDGINGVTLHVDVSNSFAHQNFVIIPNACFTGTAGTGFDAIKAVPANFGPNNPRRFAYHYAIFSHRQATTDNGSSGCAELPGNDFQVSLGAWPGQNGTIMQQAGTLMHEFGHNLNLGHGGGDGVNFKPNYLSVMNYRFQVSGIGPTDPDGAGPLTAAIDYSRSALANLDETTLAEPNGISDGGSTTFFVCPDGSTASGAGNTALDWNCNGVTTNTGVSDDVNGDRACIAAGTNGVLESAAAGDDIVSGTQIWDGPDRTCNSAAAGDDQQLRAVGNVQPNPLNGYFDWNNILFDFQTTASFEDGAHTPIGEQRELDTVVYQQVLAPDLEIAQAAAPALVATGSNVTYTLVVHNKRPTAATSVVVTDLLPASTVFMSCAASGGGVCGGAGNNRTVTFASIPGGGTATLTLVANVNCPVADGTSISNTATVAFADADPTPDDNTSTTTVTASNPPPVIAGQRTDRTSLWPPNHGMVNVAVSYDVTDNCGAPACSLTVTSNEPANGAGDGNTSQDWQIVDAHHLLLRAERSGNGSGRIYTIVITCSDSAGGSSAKTLTVVVPKSR